MGLTKIRMCLEKETKGTHVYRELNAAGQPIENNRECLIGSLYIQKSSPVGKDRPDEITVEVSYDS